MSCDTTSSNDDEVELRVAGVTFSLGLTHNSHLGRGYSTPESSYSATITFEVYLTEETDYTKINSFALVDEEQSGWVFDSLEVQNAYNENNNSLIFDNLQLRVFDTLSGKLISAQFRDNNDEIIRERGFTLDNDFPLPALTSLDPMENGDVQLIIDFYNTPYDGGNIPFAVTIYNTFFSSNNFVVVWLNANDEIIRQDYFGTNELNETDSGDYSLDISNESIPSDAEKVFTTFRRGSYTRGGVLYTRVISLP